MYQPSLCLGGSILRSMSSIARLCSLYLYFKSQRITEAPPRRGPSPSLRHPHALAAHKMLWKIIFSHLLTLQDGSQPFQQVAPQEADHPTALGSCFVSSLCRSQNSRGRLATQFCRHSLFRMVQTNSSHLHRKPLQQVSFSALSTVHTNALLAFVSDTRIFCDC